MQKGNKSRETTSNKQRWRPNKDFGSRLSQPDCNSAQKEGFFAWKVTEAKPLNVIQYGEAASWCPLFWARLPTMPRDPTGRPELLTHVYFTDNDSPYRASNLLKSAKILIVLEDPVKRALSHYQVGISGQTDCEQGKKKSP